MSTYVILGQFTDQGIRNVKESTKRANVVKEMAKKAGGNMKEIFWTLGQYDIVALLDAPDDSTATAVLLGIGSMGNVRTTCLRAFNADEMSKVIGKLP